MDKEDIISSRVGKENPFRTPDGYFDDFTQRMMKRIHESEQSRQAAHERPRLRPWKAVRQWAAAAVVAGVCVAGGTYFMSNRADRALFAERGQGEELFTDELLDQALDYEMACGLVDNNRISYYLTAAEN